MLPEVAGVLINTSIQLTLTLMSTYSYQLGLKKKKQIFFNVGAFPAALACFSLFNLLNLSDKITFYYSLTECQKKKEKKHLR